MGKRGREGIGLLGRTLSRVRRGALGALGRHHGLPLHELHSFGLEIQDSADPTSVARALVSAVGRVMTVQPVVISLPQEHGEKLVVAVAVGSGERSHPILQARSALVTWLQEQDGAVSKAHVWALPQWQGLSEHEQADIAGMGIELFVPLAIKDSLLGLLMIGGQVGWTEIHHGG